MEKQENQNEKKYEEPEIVNAGAKGSEKTDFEDMAKNFAKDEYKNAKRSVLLAGGLSLFFTIFIVFAVLGLIIALILWLLPFALAAFIITVVGGGLVLLVTRVIGLFKK